MNCAGCGGPLDGPWGQCNLTPAVSYHRECCPGCTERPAAYPSRAHPHGATGYYNYRCRRDFCKGAASVVNRRRSKSTLRRGVRT